jgi:hypothetical protein
VLFLVGLSGNILLGLLMWWHRELFFSWNHGGRQCWGFENRMESPNTRITNKSRGSRVHESRKAERQRIFESLNTP